MPVLQSPFAAATDLRLRLAGPFLLFLIGFMFFRLKMYLDLEGHLLVNQVIIALLAGYFGWELTRFTALFIQRKLPGLQRISMRIVYLVVALVVLAHIGYAIRRIIHIIADGEPWQWPSLLDYSGTTGVVLFYTTITLSIYEGAYFFKQWKQTALEKEKLIQSEWQAKYDLLKAQVNPHFLFNSLNSLSSLISENPEKAEQFTDEMSKVYRYLLRSNHEELVTLASELQFIRSYTNLLKVRYGNGFSLEISVDKANNALLLPALSLQLLVENAVKHNVVMKDQPLNIVIKMTGDKQLAVINNVQKKKISVPSSGIGLKNIDTKYKLLKLDGIYVEEANGHFVVTLPLMAPA